MRQPREIHDHETNPFNTDHVRVLVMDPADENAGNASHVYKVFVDSGGEEGASETTLKFQHGPIKEAGVNGITDQALLAIVLDRFRAFQSSKWRNRETAVSITKLEEALMWQQKRTQDRERRGVEGTNAL